LVGIKVIKPSYDSTDLLLQVTESTEGKIENWDKTKIVTVLKTEINIPKESAEKIANLVEKRVLSSGVKRITVNLIRELVNSELFSHGFTKKLEKQETIGMSFFELDKLILNKSNENSNVSANNPEAINLSIAENALKQYALKKVFSEQVSTAHLKGEIHLHDLGFIQRVYCSSHSLEYIKKYGLKSLINLSTDSSPAKHASTLTGHLNTFLASMQSYYAGALGIAYLNVFYAPYLVGMTYKQIKQQAQYLIFSLSQNAFSRGNQTLFINLNIHLNVPDYLKDTKAIGPGGVYKGTYKDYEKETKLFAKALLEVWKEGDKNGQPFPFPICNLHIDKNTFEKDTDLFKSACEATSENGCVYFVFDRDAIVLSACCRLKTTLKDFSIFKHPESIRYCGFQNVTINLPQASYRANGDLDKTIVEISKSMKIAMKAHLEKKKFIEKLMSKPNLPLWQIGKKSDDGKPYVNLEEATYIIGIIGLNECVKKITGKELHESEKAYKIGLKIISAMYLKTKEFKKETGLTVSLEESPAESCGLRLAKIDLKRFPESKEFIKGDKRTGQVFYTNSIHLNPEADVDILERIEKQAKFNPLIESGSITHVFLGEQKPDPVAIYSLVKKTWENTQCSQLVISPEFTVCKDCKKMSRGYNKEKPICSYCNSKNVYGMSRVVGYYSKIENWNDSKQAEFESRQKGDYKL